MRLVLYLCLAEASFGMAFVQLFIPRAALGPGFGKTIAATCFFCLLGPALTLRHLLPFAAPGDLLALRACLWAAEALWFAYFIAMNYPKEPSQRLLLGGAAAAQAAAVSLSASILAARFHGAYDGEGFGPSLLALHASLLLGTLCSSLLLGTATMAMLIGHWYLVIPGLALKWLKGACAAFGVSILLKAASICVSLWIGARADPFGPSGFMDRYLLHYITLFAPRAISLAIPAALSVMAYKAAAMGSTQSSTGILFPALIIVLLGEMIGIFLVSGLAGLAV